MITFIFSSLIPCERQFITIRPINYKKAFNSWNLLLFCELQPHIKCVDGFLAVVKLNKKTSTSATASSPIEKQLKTEPVTSTRWRRWRICAPRVYFMKVMRSILHLNHKNIHFIMFICIIIIIPAAEDTGSHREVKWIWPLQLRSRRKSLGCVYIAVILTHVTDVNYLLDSEGSERLCIDGIFPPRNTEPSIFFWNRVITRAVAALAHGMKFSFNLPPSIISQLHLTVVAYILWLFLRLNIIIAARERLSG